MNAYTKTWKTLRTNINLSRNNGCKSRNIEGPETLQKCTEHCQKKQQHTEVYIFITDCIFRYIIAKTPQIHSLGSLQAAVIVASSLSQPTCH